MQTSKWLLTGAMLVVVGLVFARPAIELPVENVRLRPSPLPGYQVAVNRCAICHSADYIAYQPPGMNLTQWTGEVTKMHHTYGAPIEAESIRLVGIYLSSVYGAATSLPAADLAGPAAARIDGAQALLQRNGCLACHSNTHKSVGPAYHDVAEKYRGDADAVAKLQHNIRNGGTDRWGSITMPPYATLSDAQLKALAEYVLAQ